MKKPVLLFLFFVIFLASAAAAVDLRAVKIEKFLANYCPESPLRGRGPEMVRYADEFGLDYRLYLAIAGAESGFGRRYPKKKHNLTGILNGETRFRSISDNIRYTNQLIAEGKWYRRYRRTKNLMDLVYIFKGVPPYEHYLRNLRFVLDGISGVSIEKEYRAEHPVISPVEANSLRYDQVTPRRVIRK
ncbi:glucosaminidase domain-containing protein [Candidatus Saganbacteria bacterium]|nr:glucosaminidase domain-containing protein [Candidatus Saganbacteria bacterium]